MLGAGFPILGYARAVFFSGDARASQKSRSSDREPFARARDRKAERPDAGEADSKRNVTPRSATCSRPALAGTGMGPALGPGDAAVSSRSYAGEGPLRGVGSIDDIVFLHPSITRSDPSTTPAAPMPSPNLGGRVSRAHRGAS